MIDEGLDENKTNNVVFSKQTSQPNQEIDNSSKEELKLENCFININDFIKEELIIKQNLSKLYKIKELKTGKFCEK